MNFTNPKIKIEQKDQILESSIGVNMEKVSLVEISDGGQVERGLEESKGGSDGDMNCVKPAAEDLKSDPPNKEGIFEGESDEKASLSRKAEFDNGDSSSDESISSDESSSDESMSVSKSFSSSEDEDEDDVGFKMREEAEALEEGEVRAFDAHKIDFLSDEEEEGPKGPIRSKHEMEDLPPVPMVEVTLQPNHKLLPVGVISSIMSNRVIIDGSVSHNPLNEGSILWVTDTRLPLGLVDEIFGPVKNPYYVVRYNTEEEVPAGIAAGIAVSFVAEFSTQILNDKDLYKKGYDASGDNDEEVDDVAEFSDDEKEAEYRKSLRAGKRANNQSNGAKQEARFERKRNTFMGPRAQHRDIERPVNCSQLSIDRPHPTGPVPSPPAPLVDQSGIGLGSWSSSSTAVTNADSISPPAFPQFPQVQAVNYIANPSQQLLTQHQNTPWPLGFCPQLQNTGLQGDIPMQLQNQNVIMNNLVNMMAFRQLFQQFLPQQGSSLPWVGAAPSLQALGQNNFASPPFGNGLINAPRAPGLGNEQIRGQAPLPLPPSMQFNAGSSALHFSGGHSRPRGGRPYQRGGGRFFDRGGWRPNR